MEQIEKEHKNRQYCVSYIPRPTASIQSTKNSDYRYQVAYCHHERKQSDRRIACRFNRNAFISEQRQQVC